MNILRQICHIWAQYRGFRQTFNELSQLSDRELKDIGISRGDIVSIAYGRAECRQHAESSPSTHAHVAVAG